MEPVEEEEQAIYDDTAIEQQPEEEDQPLYDDVGAQGDQENIYDTANEADPPVSSY